MDNLQRALEPAYRLEKVLGEGATAKVYLAEDLKHGRQVAIKVLHAGLGATVGADRFVREIRVAARLTHPHIVPLLDSGSAQGTPYFVMPYIDGEALRVRLDRGERFSIPEAVALVTEVADALEYAHAAGIVHRDIKPENILLLRGHAVVADFGIARALSKASDPSGSLITTAGLILGTPTYISPEQAAGDVAVDGRADVYALAAVLFEMLSGRPPFLGPTAQSVIASRFMGPAPRLSSVLEGIPGALDDAIAAALALEPVDRPSSALAFARSLAAGADDRPVDVPNTVGIGAGLAGPPPSGGGQRAVGIPTNPVLPSVAVLPFANVSADPDSEFLSDGLTEDIISTLSRQRTLRVAARGSSFAFKGRRPPVREVADQLGVAHVLDGSVRRSGNNVRVTAELVDAATGFAVWSDRFDRSLDNAFVIQDEIAGAIADALSATLLHDTGAWTREALSGDAYERYLRGRFALNKRTEPELRAATEYFAATVKDEPEFALARSGLADALLLLSVYGAQRAQTAMPLAREAAARALVINPALGEAWATLGSIRALYDWDWELAEDAFRRAAALSPRSSLVWQRRAMDVLLPMGRLDEARAAIDRARALDPLSMAIATSVGVVYHLAGDLAGATRALQRASSLDPAFVMTHYFLGGVLRDAGEHAAAIEAFETAIAQSGGTPEMTAGLAQTHARAGSVDHARSLLDEMAAAAATRNVPHTLFAQVHAALGEVEEAGDALLRAAGAKEPELVFLGVRPAYRPLHDHPAFETLRGRIGV